MHAARDTFEAGLRNSTWSVCNFKAIDFIMTNSYCNDPLGCNLRYASIFLFFLKDPYFEDSK